MGVENFGTWQFFKRMVIDAQGEQEKGVRNGESPSEVQWASTHTYSGTHLWKWRERGSVQVTITREGLRWTVWEMQVERWELNAEQQRNKDFSTGQSLTGRGAVPLQSWDHRYGFSRMAQRKVWAEMAHRGRCGPDRVEPCCPTSFQLWWEAIGKLNRVVKW